jgi:hypothetical protein
VTKTGMTCPWTRNASPVLSSFRKVHAFNVVSDYAWDTSRLYTTGEVTMIPEPAAVVLLAAAVALVIVARRKRDAASARRGRTRVF